MVNTKEGLHAPGAVLTGVFQEINGKRKGTEFRDILGRQGVSLDDARVIDERLFQASKGRVAERAELVGDSDETGNQVGIQTRDFYVGLSVVSRIVSDLNPDKVLYHVRNQTPEEAGLNRSPILTASSSLRRPKNRWVR